MKEYVTFVANKQQSICVQEALFDAGFEWCGSGNQISCTDAPFIYIDSDGSISQGQSFVFASEAKYIKIDSDEIISNPFQLEGAKKSEPELTMTVGGKEFSESTIKAALAQYTDFKEG